jgi:hypothetical protein
MYDIIAAAAHSHPRPRHRLAPPPHIIHSQITKIDQKYKHKNNTTLLTLPAVFQEFQVKKTRQATIAKTKKEGALLATVVSATVHVRTCGVYDRPELTTGEWHFYSARRPPNPLDHSSSM